MKSDSKDWALLVLACVLAFWALVQFVQPLLPKASGGGLSVTELAIQAASAVGTAVAAAVALYFGVDAQRARLNQDAQRMRLSAAGCYPRLKALEQLLSLAAAAQVFGNKTDDQAFGQLAEMYTEFDFSLYRATDDELMRLVPLPDNFAGRLAKIQSELSLNGFEVLKARGGWNAIPEDYRTWLVKRWTSTLAMTAYELRELVEVLGSEAQLATTCTPVFPDDSGPDW